MKRNSDFNRFNNQGFTLIELIVVLIIIGILAAYAIPSYRQFMLRKSVNNQVNNIITDLTFAKVTAVKYAQQVVVLKKGAKWKNGWDIFIDNNKDEIYDDPGDVLLRSEDAITPGVVLSSTSGNYIYFDSLGSSPNGPSSITISHPDISETKTINVALSGLISSY